jgi:hypothetical protein
MGSSDAHADDINISSLKVIYLDNLDVDTFTYKDDDSGDVLTLLNKLIATYDTINLIDVADDTKELTCHYLTTLDNYYCTELSAPSTIICPPNTYATGINTVCTSCGVNSASTENYSALG